MLANITNYKTVEEALADTSRRCVGIASTFNLRHGHGTITARFLVSPDNNETATRAIFFHHSEAVSAGTDTHLKVYKSQQVEFRLEQQQDPERDPEGLIAREVTCSGGAPFACRCAPARKAPKPERLRFSREANPDKVGIPYRTLDEVDEDEAEAERAKNPDLPADMPAARAANPTQPNEWPADPTLAHQSRGHTHQDRARARAAGANNAAQPNEGPADNALAQASRARAGGPGASAHHNQGRANGALAHASRARRQGAVVKRGGGGGKKNRGGARGGRRG